MTDKLEAISQSITQNHVPIDKNGIVIDSNANLLLQSSPQKDHSNKYLQGVEFNDANVHIIGMQNTTATNKSEIGSDLTLNQINEIKPMVLMDKIKLHNLEEEKYISADEHDNDELAGQSTDRIIGKGTKSPRSKIKKKMTLRSTSKAAKQSLFKETESTKVKKQDKFEQTTTHDSQRWNRAHPPPSQQSVLKIQKNNVQMKQSPSQMRMIAGKHQNHSSLHVGSTSEKQRVSGLRLGSQLRPTGSKLLVDKNQRGSNLRISDQDCTPKGGHKQVPEPPKLDPKEQAKHDEYWRFRLEPKDPDSDDEYICYSRLMRKLNNIKLKNPDEFSEDALNNSYNIDVSSVSSVDEEPEEADEETEQSPVKKKAKKKPKKKSVKQMMAAMFGKAKEAPNAKAKKARKPVMNVYCTDYEVVKKSAKVYAGFRLKERREDHDGAIVKGMGGQKLAEDWDVSWHDLGITADYFAKMQPYQKVSQFPGIYSVCRKNNLARNLMKMKKAFPDKFRFFPRTYILPGEASEFRNQFTDRNGRPINRRKTYIVKPDNLAQGRGIYLSRNCEKVIESCTNEGGGWVVQEYLASPHLIEDLKYDLRLYVLLYGLNPLRIYIHEQGLARFATEPYEKPRPANLDNMFVHLTNYAINKMNANFKQNNRQAKGEDEYGDYDEEESDDYGDEEEGHKRSLFAILKILYSQGADPDKVMAEIKDIVIKTIVSGQPYMHHTYRVCQPECLDNSMCFQVLGFDIMIDKNFRPWLIEVNQSPSFATDSPLDYEVKRGVLKDTFALLNVSPERRETYIRERAEQAAERMLKGKTIKLGNEERQARRQERLEERFTFERQRINEGSGYELVYPPLGDDELEAEYEGMIQKAQDIWDEFTTGKGKKRLDEAKAAEQQKLDKRKSQAATAGQGTPGGGHPQEPVSASDTSSSHKEEEILAGTEELLACNGESQQSEGEKAQQQSEEQQQAGFDPQVLADQLEESQGPEINEYLVSQDIDGSGRPIQRVIARPGAHHLQMMLDEHVPTATDSGIQTRNYQAHHGSSQSQAVEDLPNHNGRETKRQSPSLEQLCDRLELEGPQAAPRLQGLEHLHSLAEAHQATDRIIKAAQKQQLEQLQGRDSSNLGAKKNSKFGDMIQMIKMAQAHESATNQLLTSCVAHQNKPSQSQHAVGQSSAPGTANPPKSYQHLVGAPRGPGNHLGVSPVKMKLIQPTQIQTLGGFGKGSQYHQAPQANQAKVLTTIRGNSSQDRKQHFTNVSKQAPQPPIPLHGLQSGGNFTSLQATEESERSMRPEETPQAARRKGYAPGGVQSGAPTPQQSAKLTSGFDMVASAAYAHSGAQFDGIHPPPGGVPGGGRIPGEHSKRSSPTVGMNIRTFAGSQASAMDQFTMARLQGLQNQSKQQPAKYQGGQAQAQQPERHSPATAYRMNVQGGGGQIFLQGHRKVQHQQENASAHKRGSPSISRDVAQRDPSLTGSNSKDNEERQRSRKISTQPGSHNYLPTSQQNDKQADKSLVIRPDRIHFQDQGNVSDASQPAKASRTVASKYTKESPLKVKGHAKSQVPSSHYHHAHDLESWQGQQTIDKEYLYRAQNIKLLKSEAKASPLYSTKGLEHIGVTPDGQNHYNYKLTLFNKAGQHSVKGAREGGPYEPSDGARVEPQAASAPQQTKTNSTAHSERFRIAALRDSRRGSLYANQGQPPHAPFALASSFQAAGQQALFGNLGSSQLPQQRGETLPLHRHSIGPGVVAGRSFHNSDSPPQLDHEGNAFFPGGQHGSNRKLAQAQFATPQQRASEKLGGPQSFASMGQSPAHPSSVKSPYDPGFTIQSPDKSGMLRNPSASRQQLLVPILSSQSASYAQHTQEANNNVPFSSSQDSVTHIDHPGFRKQKQVSNAILLQANQIISQVNRNSHQHQESPALTANGQAILGGGELRGSRRSPLAEAMSPSFPALTETLSPVRPQGSGQEHPFAQIDSSYDQSGDISTASRQPRPARHKINDSSTAGTSLRLHERAQRSGKSPPPNINPGMEASPKAAGGPRGPNQYEAYQLVGLEDRVQNSLNSANNTVINMLGSSQGPSHTQHTTQAARRQLINKHTNINFANF